MSESVFKCSICSKEYVRDTSLRRHYIDKHQSKWSKGKLRLLTPEEIQGMQAENKTLQAGQKHRVPSDVSGDVTRESGAKIRGISTASDSTVPISSSSVVPPDSLVSTTTSMLTSTSSSVSSALRFSALADPFLPRRSVTPLMDEPMVFRTPSRPGSRGSEAYEIGTPRTPFHNSVPSVTGDAGRSDISDDELPNSGASDLLRSSISTSLPIFSLQTSALNISTPIADPGQMTWSVPICVTSSISQPVIMETPSRFLDNIPETRVPICQAYVSHEQRHVPVPYSSFTSTPAIIPSAHWPTMLSRTVLIEHLFDRMPDIDTDTMMEDISSSLDISSANADLVHLVVESILETFIVVGQRMSFRANRSRLSGNSSERTLGDLEELFMQMAVMSRPSILNRRRPR